MFSCTTDPKDEQLHKFSKVTDGVSFIKGTGTQHLYGDLKC